MNQKSQPKLSRKLQIKKKNHLKSHYSASHGTVINLATVTEATETAALPSDLIQCGSGTVSTVSHLYHI